jgi:hypothetical protein
VFFARCVIAIIFFVSTALANNCNEIFGNQADFEKALKKANEKRAQKRHEEYNYKLDWRYQLAKLVGDKQMQKSIERVKNEVKIPATTHLSSIRSEEEFDKFAWLDILANFPKDKIENLLIELYFSSNQYKPFIENFTELINAMIDREIVSYKFLEKFLKDVNKVTPTIRFSFIPNQKKVYFYYNTAQYEIMKIKSMIERSALSTQMKEEWFTLLMYKYPGDEIIDIIDVSIKELPNDLNAIPLANEFLDYLTTLKKKERKRVAKGFSHLFDKEVKPVNWFQGIVPRKYRQKLRITDVTADFVTRQKKLNEYYANAYKKEILDISKVNGHTKFNKRQYKAAAERAAEKRGIYRDVLNQCMRNKNRLSSKEPKTLNDKKNTRRFTRFKVLTGMGITGGVYTWVHWDDPWEEETGEMAGRMGYEVAWVALFKAISAFVVTGKSLHWFYKYVIHYGVGSVTDIPYSSGIAFLFEENKEEIDKKIEQLMKDPNYKKRVEEMVEVYEKHGVIQKLHDFYLKKLKGIELPEGKSLLEELKSPKDLQRDEIRLALAQMFAQEIYLSKKKSDTVETGIEWIDNLNIPVEKTGHAF